jgi:outer membrane protein assembly factor BamB
VIRGGARAALLAALALGAAGCATLETSDDRVNPDKPLWLNRPSGALHVLFRRELTVPARGVGEAYERGRAEIDPLHGRVFVGTSDRGLYALRASNGSTIWRFETLGMVQSEPLYDDELDVVYFGSNDGALYAVHASDGSLLWRYDTGGEVARKPVRGGETIFFANAADNLFAADRRTGKPLWHVHRTPALGMEVAGYAGPALDQGVVFFAFSDGHVGAFDARDGSERWAPVDLSAEAEQAQGGQALRYLDVDTTPVPNDLGTTGRVIYVASYAGGVYALDQEHGAPVWKNEKAAGVTDLTLWRERPHVRAPEEPGYVAGAPPVPGRQILFASSGITGMWALDPRTGKMIWRVPVPEGGITAPAPVNGALLVGTTRYGAFLLSPLNGHPIDGIDLGSGFSQTPAAFGGRAFMLTNAGTFLGLQVDPP